MNATKQDQPPPAAITDPKTPPNAFEIEIFFSLTRENELASGGIVAKRKSDGQPLEINLGDLFNWPIFRHSLFEIDSEIEKSGGVRPFMMRSSFAYVILGERELIAYDVAELKESATPDDAWSPFLPARYALNKSGRSNAAYAEKIASAFCIPFEKGDAWWDFAGHVDQKYSLVPDSCEKFKVDGELTLRRHLLGEFACVAPIPPFDDPGRLPGHAVVLGGTKPKGEERCLSGHVQETLQQLTHALRGRDNQIIWIMGEPGSGKEVFAQALHYGSLSGRRKSRLPNDKGELAKHLKKDAAFSIVSVAGIGVDEFNERLFAVRPKKADQQAGTTLIEDADGGGTIFLDEFDKPTVPEAIYNTLLRVLEAREYIERNVIDKQMATTPKGYDKVNWLFAGAFTKKDLKAVTPPDLWSRLTGFIETYNFVEGDDDYAISLFLYFYLRSVIEIYSSEKDIDGILKVLDVNNKAEIASVTKVLLGMERTEGLESPKPFIPTKPLWRLASRFSKAIIKPVFEGHRADSSRAIRQAAKAVFDRLRDAAIEDKTFSLQNETHEAVVEEAIRNGERALVVARGP